MDNDPDYPDHPDPVYPDPDYDMTVTEYPTDYDEDDSELNGRTGKHIYRV